MRRENLDSEAEWKFKNLAENLSELVYRADINTFAATYVNSSVEKIYGYTVEEWINAPKLWEQTIFPEDKEMVFKKISEAHEKLVSISLEYRFMRKDGKVRWGQDNISWEKDHMGNVISLLGVMYDITERKNAEKALQDSEEQFRTLVEKNPYGVQRIDVFGTIIYANKAHHKIYGYEEGALVGRSITDFIVPGKMRDELPGYLAILVKDQPIPTLYHQKILTKSGKERDIEVSWNYLRDKKGDVAGFLSVLTDVTEREKTKESLIESEEKYRTLFQRDSDSIFIFDPDTTHIIDANNATSKMYGYDKDDLIGMSCLNLSAEIEESASAIDIIREDDEVNVPYRLHRKKDGTVFPVDISGHAIILGGEKLMYAISKDISERKQAEDVMRELDKMESIGTLAGGIAHDFNNLLTAILSNMFLIKKLSKAGGKVHKLIESTEKASMKAQSLTQQLLTFARGGSPIKEVVNIKNVIDESVSLSLRGSNVQCKVCSDDIWHVEVDAGQMNQVFNNIIINADQSMPNGGTIIIDCKNVSFEGERKDLPLDKGNYVKVSFKDQGTGISDEHLLRVFDPYFTTKQKGSGLGLSTAYSIVNRHGGHIYVESSAGNGTAFHIFLPASKEKTIDRKLSQAEPIIGEGKILIMDDDELVRDSLGQMLEKLGYSSEFAIDGKEAVEAYKSAMASGQPFDVVIMDLTIPGGPGGKETIEKLKKVDPNIKAIVSSGYSNNPVMANYRDYGFKAVLPKPYRTIEALSFVLNDVIKEPY